MKTNISLVFFCLCITHAFAQDESSFQPDSFYKALHLKSRTGINKLLHSKNVIFFNSESVITEIIDYRKNGILRREFIYDSTGKLTTEEDNYKGSWDSVHKKRSSDDTSVIYNKVFSYDESGQLKAERQEFLPDGSFIRSEYQCDPILRITVRHYRDGKTITDSIFYDTGYISLREKRVVKKPGEAAEVSDMKFKNYFDEQGRILKRERIIEGASQVDPYIFDTQEFGYNNKGLLIEMIYKNVWVTMKETFSYQYWK